MIETNPASVVGAFEILLEEMEAEIEFISQVGSKAFASRDYEHAREALAHADRATAFREKVAALRGEWEKAVPSTISKSEESDGNGRRNGNGNGNGHVRRGPRTRESAYFKPILMVLQQLGGNGQANEVLERVQKVMKGTLRDVDFEPLASDSELPRWWNTAQWAHRSMVQSGLLKSDSPQGIWEMTEAGSKLIAELNS